jgi:hypothetical protein
MQPVPWTLCKCINSRRTKVWGEPLHTQMRTLTAPLLTAQCGADSLSGDRLGCFNLSVRALRAVKLKTKAERREVTVVAPPCCNYDMAEYGRSSNIGRRLNGRQLEHGRSLNRTQAKWGRGQKRAEARRDSTPLSRTVARHLDPLTVLHARGHADAFVTYSAYKLLTLVLRPPHGLSIPRRFTSTACPFPPSHRRGATPSAFVTCWPSIALSSPPKLPLHLHSQMTQPTRHFGHRRGATPNAFGTCWRTSSPRWCSAAAATLFATSHAVGRSRHPLSWGRNWQR